MKTGIELITKERKRQIEKEGWTAEIDRLQRQNEELKVGDKIDIGGFITELKEIKFDKMANIFLYWFYNEAGEYKYNVREFMFKVVEDNNK